MNNLVTVNKLIFNILSLLRKDRAFYTRPVVFFELNDNNVLMRVDYHSFDYLIKIGCITSPIDMP